MILFKAVLGLPFMIAAGVLIGPRHFTWAHPVVLFAGFYVAAVSGAVYLQGFA